ncbi:MAG: methylcrotonoyl-CoA carboxylase, partial [Burkholderiaceae bacterium]
MSVLASQINTRSDEFKASREAMAGLVADLKQKVARVTEGGGAEARAKHMARGKLLPRERVELLLD